MGSTWRARCFQTLSCRLLTDPEASCGGEGVWGARREEGIFKLIALVCAAAGFAAGIRRKWDESRGVPTGRVCQCGVSWGRASASGCGLAWYNCNFFSAACVRVNGE